MKSRKPVFLGLTLSIVLILALGFTFPTDVHFDPNNTHWNGLSSAVKNSDPNRVTDLGDLREEVLYPSQSTLLIVGPTENFGPVEAQEVDHFLDSGGRVVLADDFGTGNDLLEGLEVDARFSGVFLKDYVFKRGGSKLPTVENVEVSPLTENVSSLALNYSTTLENLGEGSTVLARSSRYSYAVERPERGFEDRENEGPFPILAQIKYRDGNLVLMSDPSVFINSMLDKENNEALLKSLSGDREIYVDVSHLEETPLSRYKALLRRFGRLAARPIMRYLLVLLVTMTIFKVSLSMKEKEEERDELKRIMERHPDWDEEQLKKLNEEKDGS